MGAWGTGFFDNDDAADWVIEFTPSDDKEELLRAAFADVLEAAEGDYLDLAEGSVALAAAGWIARFVPGCSPVGHDELEPSTSPVPVTRELVVQAAHAIEAVLGDGSEWHELWDEAGDLSPILEATRVLNALRDRLDEFPDPDVGWATQQTI